MNYKFKNTKNNWLITVEAENEHKANEILQGIINGTPLLKTITWSLNTND